MSSSTSVVIDCRWITPTPSGIGVYTKELVRHLPLLESTWKWHLLFKDKALADRTIEECGLKNNPKVFVELFPYGPFSPKGQIKLPKLLRELRCQIFHSTNFFIPYLAFGSFGTFFGKEGPKNKGGGIAITTIHDVIPLILKEYAPRSKTTRFLWLYRELLRATIRTSSATITGSETSKADIGKTLKLPIELQNSITTIYDGVSDRFTMEDTGAKDPKDAKVILYVGRLDPYKNVPLLVDAFSQLKRKVDAPIHLLIVGPDDPRYPEAREHAEARGITDSVTFLSDATDSELLDAYKSASLLVNPSRYEGFGLPMLEAMRCAVPVIAADGGSQREISGGAAKIVPVGDEPALVSMMEKVLFDENERKVMIEKGRERSMEFTWKKTAEKTLCLYKETLASKQRIK